MKDTGQLLYWLVSCLLLTACVTAIPLNEFYPFGAGAGDSSVPRIDDGSSPPVSLPQKFFFFRKSFDTIYVSSNSLTAS